MIFALGLLESVGATAFPLFRIVDQLSVETHFGDLNFWIVHSKKKKKKKKKVWSTLSGIHFPVRGVADVVSLTSRFVPDVLAGRRHGH